MSTRRSRGVPKNDAADKIWNDHLGNNAFVWHRDQCAVCLEAYETRLPSQTPAWCPDGDRIFHEMLDEVCAQMDEAIENQN
jgi:hypothetical protein